MDCSFTDSIRGTPWSPPRVDGQVLTLLQGPVSGRVLFPSLLLVLSVVVDQLAVPQLPHGYTVGQSTHSQLVIVSFMEKHDVYHLTLGQEVKCWALAVMFISGYWVSSWMLSVMMIAGYWNCLATMVPHSASNFVIHMFLYHALGPQNWRHQHSQLDVYTYLFPPSDL